METNQIDVKTLEILWHNKEPVLSIDFHPSMQKMATCGGDKTVKLWKLDSNKKDEPVEFLSSLFRHTMPVNIVRFSPCGKYLASGGDDGEVYVWQMDDKKEMAFGEDNEEGQYNKEWWTVFKRFK